MPIYRIPREINPDRGWIATANQFNLPADYPVDDPPIGFEWVALYRYQRIAEVLSEFNKSDQHSFEDSTDLQTDFLSIPIRILTEALAETEPDEDQLVEARDWLTEWDNVFVSLIPHGFPSKVLEMSSILCDGFTGNPE